jgi:hypothetical protein
LRADLRRLDFPLLFLPFEVRSRFLNPQNPQDPLVKQTMATRTIAILFPGDMGSGFGRLLRSASIKVVTNLEGRSTRTRELAESNGIEDLGSDNEILSSAEIIISVLVPSFARSTAERIVSASKSLDRSRLRTKFYIDANAIAPSTTIKIGELFKDTGITFIDGSIIGGPPRLNPGGGWYKPSFALSGPGTRDLNLDHIFDISHVGANIGQASALKMSFASLTKVHPEFLHALCS